MILGALLDAGLDIRELESELNKLKISGYKIKAEKTNKKGITGTKFSVDVTEQNAERNLADIIKLVDRSDLDDDIKDLSQRAFRELAAVEAQIITQNEAGNIREWMFVRNQVVHLGEAISAKIGRSIVNGVLKIVKKLSDLEI